MVGERARSDWSELGATFEARKAAPSVSHATAPSRCRMTLLQRLRIFLGVPTANDKRAADAEMWKNIHAAVHAEDLRDVEADETTSLADVTRREKRRRKW